MARNGRVRLALPLVVALTLALDEAPRPARASPAEASAAPSSDVEAGRAERVRLRTERCEADPRVLLGQVSLATCIGADLFFRETFGGNGRTCSSCHPANNNYTVDPKSIAKLPATDPLFVAERDPALAELEIPGLLRKHALFVVHADGFDDPGEKFVVRSSQHLLGLGVSRLAPTVKHPQSDAHAIDGTLLPIPAERLGWSGDGAPGEGRLRDFADGAIKQHAPRSLRRAEGADFFLPDAEEAEAIAAFSGSIGRMNDLDLSKVRLYDRGAARGLESFLRGRGRECGFRCHTNAGAIETLFETFEPDSKILGYGNVTLDIGTELARLPDVDAAGLLLDGGHGTRAGDLNGDGVPDSFGNRAFNAPPLIEAADTGPMFHTNAEETVEDAIRFYTTDHFARSLVAESAFPNRASGEPMLLEEQDILELGRFLRVLNTSLNLQMALYRLDAARKITERFGHRQWSVERGLIELAAAELTDALEVLAAVDGLHPPLQRTLRHALAVLEGVVWLRPSAPIHARILGYVRRSLSDASRRLGTGLAMKMGEGTLMF